MSRFSRWGRVVLAGALAVLAAVPALAGTTGKLTGRVVDDKKQPLPGVNIRVEGQRLGGITDDQGTYFIIGIPAGRYTVRMNLIGFAPYAAENVEVQPDFSTTLDATLKTEAVQMNEVVVNAERPLLQKDATGTTRFLSGSEIQQLPTRGYRDAAAQQTGVVNFKRQIDNEAQNSNTLIIRGGRPNETAYFVDGFSQQDPLTGTSTTSISNNAIEEVVLLTGGFSPEYGRIMSGAANVITREGGSKYFGALEGVTDNLAGNWIQAPKTDYNVYDFSLGGPVLPKNDKLTFFASGERRWQRDRSPSAHTGLFDSQLINGTKYTDDLVGAKGLDPDLKPNNSSSGITYQGKLSWSLTDHVMVKAGTLGSRDDWNQYVHTYLFDATHMPQYADRNQSYFMTMNHAINQKTFYNLGANFFKTDRTRGDGVAFDDLNPQYIYSGTHPDTLEDINGADSIVVHPVVSSHNGTIDPTGGGYYRNVNPRFDTDLPMFWKGGHVFDDFLRRNSSYYGLQGSLSSQFNAHNQLKAGGDFQSHTLRYFRHLNPANLGGEKPNLNDFDAYGYNLIVTYKDVSIRDIHPRASDGKPETTFTASRVADGVRIDENSGGRDGPKHPKAWSLYMQDKYEREGLIVNGGLRFDHFNVDTEALRSEQFPLGQPGTQSDSLQGLLDNQDLVTNRTYARLSPRLGVAFPVDDKTILRFNYGQFYQQPNLQDLYVSYRYLDYKVKPTGAGYYYGFGNPNLRPERTTAYETGIQRQMGDNVRLDVTAYYKDVKDLVEVASIPAGTGAQSKGFASFRNRDFATIKGVDIGFVMRRVNHISANVNYSLSYANGTGSVSNTQRNVAWTATEPPKQTSPLDFDQRHKLSMNLDWRMEKGEGPMWRSMRPLEDAGVNLLFNMASGTPFTPTQIFNEATLAAVSNLPSGPINSRYGPWSVNVDLKATRGFRARGLRLEAYAWVLNLLDQRNPIAVYTGSGSAETTNWLSTNEGQGYLATAAGKGVDGESLYRLAENDPSLYSNPRLVRFGLRTSF